MIQETSSWNTLAKRIHADKNFEGCKQSKPKVVFYYGSFNPPHFGHLNAIEEAIKKTGADFGVVVADDRINLWKPFRSTPSLRTKMLEHLFKEKDRILVAGTSKDNVRDVLLESAETIHLVGSDVFPRYFKDKVQEGKCHYPELIISFREGDPIEIPKESSNVKIDSFVQTNQSMSSTKAREALYSHPEWYESNDAGSGLPMMPKDLTAFILEHGIYSEKAQTRLDVILKEIKSHYNENILIHPLSSGLSGDSVFAVYNENKIPISTVKVFQKSSFKEDFDYSMQAGHYLEASSWQWIKSAKIEWSSVHEEYAFLGQSYVEGKDMGSFWKLLTHTPEQIEEIQRQSLCIGRSLRELHDSTQRTMDTNLLEQHLDKLKNRQKGLERHQLEEFLQLLEQYRLNPGCLSNVHGDAGPGNFFVGKDGVVTYVDLGDMARKGACAEAKGFPGYEYMQFISSLFWFCRVHHANDFLVDGCVESFKRGYAGENNKPQPFSKEAEAFYSFYWKVK